MNANAILKKAKLRKKREGLTTVEMIASISIFLLVTVIVVQTFIATQTIWQDAIVNVWVQDSAKNAMQVVAKELKEAGSLLPAEISISSDQRSIGFDIPNATDATRIISWDRIDYAFDPSSGELTRSLNSGSPSIIGRNLGAVQFERLGDAIQVSITALATTAQGKSLKTALVSEVAVRN